MEVVHPADSISVFEQWLERHLYKRSNHPVRLAPVTDLIPILP